MIQPVVSQLAKRQRIWQKKNKGQVSSWQNKGQVTRHIITKYVFHVITMILKYVWQIKEKKIKVLVKKQFKGEHISPQNLSQVFIWLRSGVKAKRHLQSRFSSFIQIFSCYLSPLCTCLRQKEVEGWVAGRFIILLRGHVVLSHPKCQTNVVFNVYLKAECYSYWR